MNPPPPWLIEQLKGLFSNPGMFLATYFKAVLPKMFHLKPYAEWYNLKNQIRVASERPAVVMPVIYNSQRE